MMSLPAVKCFDVHCACADGVEKPCKAGKLVIGERLEERQVFHGGGDFSPGGKGAAGILFPEIVVLQGAFFFPFLYILARRHSLAGGSAFRREALIARRT